MGMGFAAQVAMMTRRNLTTIWRVPASWIPGILISVFFLFVYDSSLSSIAVLPAFQGKSYLGFILPVAIISASMGGGGIAGQSLVRDLETGYFAKLLLTPASRGALILAPILSGALLLGVQAALIVGLGLAMGWEPPTGWAGIAGVIGLSILLGTAFAGYVVGVALRTGSASATEGATFLFFPLSFITSTFVPTEMLTGWIKVAAPFNPITYLLDALRMLMHEGWDASVLVRGLSVTLAMGAVTYTFALLMLRARVRAK